MASEKISEAKKERAIIHLGSYPCDIDNHYQPELELRGAVPATRCALGSALEEHFFAAGPELQALQAEWETLQNPRYRNRTERLSFEHRARVAQPGGRRHDHRKRQGVVHIWMAHHFFAFEPRKLLFSNGQQTLGRRDPVGHGGQSYLSCQEGGRGRLPLFVDGTRNSSSIEAQHYSYRLSRWRI